MKQAIAIAVRVVTSMTVAAAFTAGVGDDRAAE